MDIKTMTVNELKVLFFDEQMKRDIAIQNLNAIIGELQARQTQEQPIVSNDIMEEEVK
jgi:hypothetical protein